MVGVELEPGVLVGVKVGVLVGVKVGVNVGVKDGVLVGVFVGVFVGVGVGVGVDELHGGHSLSSHPFGIRTGLPIPVNINVGPNPE